MKNKTELAVIAALMYFRPIIRRGCVKQTVGESLRAKTGTVKRRREKKKAHEFPLWLLPCLALLAYVELILPVQ
jgi:hypothetical protein